MQSQKKVFLNNICLVCWKLILCVLRFYLVFLKNVLKFSFVLLWKLLYSWVFVLSRALFGLKDLYLLYCVILFGLKDLYLLYFVLFFCWNSEYPPVHPSFCRTHHTTKPVAQTIRNGLVIIIFGFWSDWDFGPETDCNRPVSPIKYGA